MNITKELLTHSSMATFKECRRKYLFAYQIGLRRIDDAKALRMGRAFHDGIAELGKKHSDNCIVEPPCRQRIDYICDDCDNRLSRACKAVRDVYEFCPQHFDGYQWAIERETIFRLVCCYQWRWGESLKQVATEKPFRLPLTNPSTGMTAKFFDLGGKMDGIVGLEDLRLAVKETKTSSEDLGDDSPLWRTLRIDHQISLYLAAARELGYAVDTVLYDVCRKPSIAPEAVPILDGDGKKIVLDANGDRVQNVTGKKEWRQTADKEKGYVLQSRPMTPEEWGEKLSADIYARPDFYFSRREIPRLDQDVEEYREEIWQIQQVIRECQRTGKWFRTVGKHCRYCPFFEPCTSGQDVEKNVPPGFEIVTDKNPELNGECNVITTNGTTETAASTAPCATGV